MDELVTLVVEKTGMSEEMAGMAVNIVLEQLKTKLPDPVAGQIDALLAGESAGLGNLTQGLGGLFGKK